MNMACKTKNNDANPASKAAAGQEKHTKRQKSPPDACKCASEGFDLFALTVLVHHNLYMLLLRKSETAPARIEQGPFRFKKEGYGGYFKKLPR